MVTLCKIQSSIKVLSRKDIQRLLRISDQEAEDIINSKSLPTITIGSTVRILEDDLYHWLKQRN
ncbi:helix-turn-helix domain-containing protein [Fictibacillus phosphorivorans]|uniref:helix-turn-helix domain-containing protein n=1 Tax=Fictibacillus phosphorivorans TaxID=1221500 RepID=UPI003CEA6099